MLPANGSITNNTENRKEGTETKEDSTQREITIDRKRQETQ
jgi:hypothetical protein